MARRGSTTPPAAKPWRLPPWVPLAAGLMAALALAYWPALRAGYVWDDDDHFVTNPLMTAPDGWRGIWLSSSAIYYPMTLSVWRVLHGAFGFESAFPYHLATLLLHGANALLLWRLWQAMGLAGGAYLAALFALHPIQVESVAWCTELKNTLSGFFALIALLLWRRGEEEARGNLQGWWRWYAPSLAVYCLALASKPTVTMLPPVMALLLWWRHESSRPWQMPWRRLAWLVPFFLLAVAWSAYTIHEQRNNSNARGGVWDIGMLDRLVLAGAVPWFYLGKLAWPWPLAFIYPRWSPDGASAGWWLPGLGIVAALLAGAALAQRGRKAPLVAMLAYLALLFPVMGFFNVYFFRFSFVADHFAYLPSIVPLGAVAWALSRCLGDPPPQAAAARVGLGAILALAMVLTFQQARGYRNEETLWEATLRRNPGAWIAHNNLGFDALMASETERAERHLRASVELAPGNWEGHLNLGILLAERGDLAEAEAHYRTSLKERPEHPDTHNNLANALALQGRRQEAIASYAEAIRLNPADAATRMNAARVLYEMGDKRQALQQLEVARKLDPRDTRIPALIEMVESSPDASR